MSDKLSKLLRIGKARIGFRNFAGKKTDYTREGVRTFSVFLDPDEADRLRADGWNVKEYTPKKNPEELIYHLPISVNFDNIPPTIVVITGNRKKTLDERHVHELDGLEFVEVDLIITPYNWTVNGKTGVKAYLRKMYAVVEEDDFAAKYRDIPEAGDVVDDGPPWD